MENLFSMQSWRSGAESDQKRVCGDQRAHTFDQDTGSSTPESRCPPVQGKPLQKALLQAGWPQELVGREFVGVE